MAMKEKVTALESHLLENGPQGFPRLCVDEKQWEIFENTLEEVNSTIYIDRDAKVLRLSEVEKEVFECNNGKKKSMCLSLAEMYLQKISSKYPYLAKNLRQKIIEYSFNANSYLVWGAEVYVTKHNQQKLPTVAEYMNLHKIYQFLTSTCGREDKENDLTKPFYPMQNIREINRTWPSIIKRNPMFFTINSATGSQSTVTWNHSAFIFDVTADKQFEICCLRNKEAIQSVSKDFVPIYIQQYLRKINKEFTSIEILFSALHLKDAPVQLQLCGIDSPANLKLWLIKNESSKFEIKENGNEVTVSIKRNSTWETLCFDLLKKAEGQAAECFDKSNSDNPARTELPTQDFVSLDNEEFMTFKKRRQEAKKRESSGPHLPKSSSKGAKQQQNSRGKNAPFAKKPDSRSTSKPKREFGHHSHQKYDVHPHSPRAPQLRAPHTPNYHRSNRNKTQQAVQFVKNNKVNSKKNDTKRKPTLSNVQNTASSNSNKSIPPNPSTKGLLPSFPTYKARPSQKVLSTSMQQTASTPRPNSNKSVSSNPSTNSMPAPFPPYIPKPSREVLTQKSISVMRSQPNVSASNLCIPTTQNSTIPMKHNPQAFPVSQSNTSALFRSEQHSYISTSQPSVQSFPSSKISTKYEFEIPAPPSASALSVFHQQPNSSTCQNKSTPGQVSTISIQSEPQTSTPLTLKTAQKLKSENVSPKYDTLNTAGCSMCPPIPIKPDPAILTRERTSNLKTQNATPVQTNYTNEIQQRSNFGQILKPRALNMQNSATDQANRTSRSNYVFQTTPDKDTSVTAKTNMPFHQNSEILRANNTQQLTKQIFKKDVAMIAQKAQAQITNNFNVISDATKKINNRLVQNFEKQPTGFQPASAASTAKTTVSQRAPSALGLLSTAQKQSMSSASELQQKSTQQSTIASPSEYGAGLNVFSKDFVPEKQKPTIDPPLDIPVPNASSSSTSQPVSASEQPKQHVVFDSETDLITSILQSNDNKMHINILFLRCQFHQQCKCFRNIQDLMQLIENDKPNNCLRINDCWVEYSR